MSVEKFVIPRNTIEDMGVDSSEEKLNKYQLTEEQKRFMSKRVLNLLT